MFCDACPKKFMNGLFVHSSSWVIGTVTLVITKLLQNIDIDIRNCYNNKIE